MKKLALWLGALLALLMLLYGTLSALVNQGHSLPAAVALLIAVAGGAGLLVWFVRNDSSP
jgi:hypothetical protein